MEGKARDIQENKEAEIRRRQSEATSKDTLSDVEQDETIPDKEGGHQRPPAPDDAGNKGRHAPDDAGPM